MEDESPRFCFFRYKGRDETAGKWLAGATFAVGLRSEWFYLYAMDPLDRWSRIRRDRLLCLYDEVDPGEVPEDVRMEARRRVDEAVV